MSEDWKQSENLAAVKAYLWLLKAEEAGFKPVKSRVREALRLGPLKHRSNGAIEYRFQNISFVLQSLGENWVNGYKPARNVGTEVIRVISSQISSCRERKERKRVDFLVAAIPENTLRRATQELARGMEYEYPDSVDYEVQFLESKLPPKKLVSYAAKLHFGAPLNSSDFVGGLGSSCFKSIENAGLAIVPRHEDQFDTNSPAFREKVRQRREIGFSDKPEGNCNPRRHERTSHAYNRDEWVVAYVENRANGNCELCGKTAPFKRFDGTAFLEVHHITPLAEGGEDTVDNAAAICPNCHRECHHGIEKDRLQLRLREIVSALESTTS